MNLITDEGLNVHVYDDGDDDGAPVILLHCSSASHKEWRFLFEDLGKRFRILAPDLIGYGQSDVWPRDKPFDVRADIGIIQRLMQQAAQPCHLIAHSYGAAMALEAARLYPQQVKSLMLIEPVSFHVLKDSDYHREWLRIVALGDRVMNAMRRGDPMKAAGAYMGYWIGYMQWLFMPRRMKRRILASMDKVAAEFSTVRSAPTRLDDYRLTLWPITLVSGTRTRDSALGIIELLSSVMNRSQHIRIPGAGHMSPFTHSNQVRATVLDHLRRATTRR